MVYKVYIAISVFCEVKTFLQCNEIPPKGVVFNSSTPLCDNQQILLKSVLW